MKIHPPQFMRQLARKYKDLSPNTHLRIRGGVAILALVVVGVYATTQIFGSTSDVTGIVFHDYNGNGKQDNNLAANPSMAADRGLAGVTVKGFAPDGKLCDTQTTDANGAYTLHFSNCDGAKFRVEFSGLPAGYNSSQVGVDSKTTTQFVAPGGVASLGAYRSLDFCQNNPKLITSCIRAGAYNDTAAEADEDSVYAFPYSISGTAPIPLKLGKFGQVGTVYGEMYRPSTKSVYSSAYMRRHDGFGPGGPGGIYKALMPSSGTGTANSSLFVTIPNAGGDPHPTSNNNCDSKDGQNSSANNDCWAHDQFAFDAPGKRSLGGIALAADPTNPANDALLVMNLNDRQLYKVTNLDGTPTPTGYALPLSLPNSGAGSLPSGSGSNEHKGCVANDVRPFAVTVHNGTGYAGFVCSAQTAKSSADLRAYVYAFNPSTMAFATVPTLELPLNYDRSCSYGSSSGCLARATWLPWISEFNDPAVTTTGPIAGTTTKYMTAPQPILADISFGDNDSMTVGFRDRYDDQMGYEAKSTNPNNSQRYSGQPAGDLIRACVIDEKYHVESAGKCNGKGPGSNGAHAVTTGLPQGFDGAEFYSNEYQSDTNGQVLSHDETSRGALAQIPGYDSFASTAIDPLDGTASNDTGGMREYNSENGARTNSFRIFQNNPGDSFLKGNGLGDMDFVCDTAPIEIGNRVWNDTNANGIQDATEPGIPNVTVTLRNSANTVIATALTDADGNYLFSNRTLDENGQAMVSTPSNRYSVAGLTANTANFKLTLSTAADYTDASRLMNLRVTTPNVTANNGNDQNDSDATVPDPTAKPSATNPATITFATGAPGDNEHIYDFGFSQTAAIGNFVWFDSNRNGKVDGAEATQGINGVKVSLYGGGADTNNDGTLSAAEQAAATPIATRITANDTRAGSTNGRPGYYEFDGLAVGDYFVGLGAANFAAGQPLQLLSASPVPPGVGDTQDDNTNHGAVPTGGSLIANGVISTKINLQSGTEPTSTSAKPDDDTSADSDLTIDFGFGHPYSLGNRVWLDKDNSATLNAEDGPTPGIGGVKLRLLSSDGNTEIGTTTTDGNGYYRFDNLNAGTYIVEVAATNFANGGSLHDHAISSVGPGEETDPDANGDNNDNGLNPPAAGQAVRSGTITLGPGAVEPTGETDLSPTGQGTDDAFANMTLDFGFIGSTSFGDTVFYDINGNGIQDAGDAGIPNVTVTLECGGADGNLATTADNTTQTQKTNSNGMYLFTGLLPGPCKATVTTSDVPNATLTTPGSFTHTIVGETSFLDADFGFRGTGSIGNQVWKEIFNNGTYDITEGDLPIPGVKIELYRDINGNGVVDNSDILVGTQTTDNNGRYQFSNLPVDDNIAANGAGAQYVVRVTDPDGKLTDLQPSVGPAPGADNNSQNPAGYGITLTANAPSNQTADFGYQGVASVGDTVYYDTNNDGHQDPNEPVLPGITVTLTYPGPDGDCKTTADNITRSMVTDANGIYMFTHLLGGDYCISIEPPAGTTITTNNQGEKFTLGPTQIDLTRDFGVIGDGTIGNQVYIDVNNNGRFDGGDTGIEGVTIDLYRDVDGNGKADAGEPVIKTATTDGNGQYNFTHLITGDNTGVKYVVVVTDTAHKLTGLNHVPGNGTTADNESKDPAGFPVVLTPTDNHHPEADFGYKAAPGSIVPPKFWKQQTVDGTSLIYTLTWINLSAVDAVSTSFTDGIPDGTAYVSNSLKCEAKGNSKTNNCFFNPALNRIEWTGNVGADLGHPRPDTAVNPIVVTFRVELATATLEVFNQGFGSYGTTQVPPVPSDWIDTPVLDDPTVYRRTPTQATIEKLTGGTLANTGQVVMAAVIVAGTIIVFSSAFVVISRRKYNDTTNSK